MLTILFALLRSKLNAEDEKKLRQMVHEGVRLSTIASRLHLPVDDVKKQMVKLGVESGVKLTLSVDVVDSTDGEDGVTGKRAVTVFVHDALRKGWSDPELAQLISGVKNGMSLDKLAPRMMRALPEMYQKVEEIRAAGIDLESVR